MTTPNSAGTWWFHGVVTVPHSTAPGNTTTVHVESPRRFEVVQTQFGLIPCEPGNHYPYALCTFDGVWETGR